MNNYSFEVKNQEYISEDSGISGFVESNVLVVLLHTYNDWIC